MHPRCYDRIPDGTLWHWHLDHVRPRLKTSAAMTATSEEPSNSGDDVPEPAVASGAPPSPGSLDSGNVAASAVLRSSAAQNLTLAGGGGRG